MTETTIVHIDTKQRLATITHGGITRLFRLLAIDPYALINLYRERGYKYSWFTQDLIFMTKKVSTKQFAEKI